jgi:aspartate/tyrosine/aromatic aminotransferase
MSGLISLVLVMSSFFRDVPLAPPNSILGVSLECKKDPFNGKIDLTIGAYRDNNGVPHVLECVREAEKQIFEEKLDHEYLSQDGDQKFLEVSQKLMFGDDATVLRENRVYSIQGISGTGSLRLACDFIAACLKGRKCYYPSVTWPNHPTLLDSAGVPSATYRYLDNTGCALDFSGLIEDLSLCPEGSIILLHLCAHNPSGVDPTDEQWAEILRVVKERKLLPFFDNAYQGFVSGCPHKDSAPARAFADTGLEMIITSSFAKNFGLYGERIGALHMVMATQEDVPKVASQLRVLSRALWSTCPLHGGRIVARILSNPALKELWERECRGMAERLNSVRAKLHADLVRLNVKGTWNHVVAQRGTNLTSYNMAF